MVELLVAGNRATTIAAYEAAWRNWTSWNVRRGYDTLHNDLGNILDYLTDLFESGVAYRTISLHRSMLFSTLNPVDGVPVGSHRLVTQLLKGCYNLNPPRPKYNSTWDPEVVLEFFREAGENEYLPIKSLAAKRVTLLALTSLLRVSEIASIERSSVVIRPDGATFLLGKPRKAQHQGPLSEISLPSCPNKRICPVSVRIYAGPIQSAQSKVEIVCS